MRIELVLRPGQGRFRRSGAVNRICLLGMQSRNRLVNSEIRVLWGMERAIPILPAEDLKATNAFYVDGLGVRVTFEASKDGRSGLLE